MKAVFGEGGTRYMVRELQDWLDLSLHRGLPSSLLLLSRAFTITSPFKEPENKRNEQYEAVRETLSTLPAEVVEDVTMELEGDGKGGVMAIEKKLEMLRREEELIKEEEEVERKAAEAGAAAPAAAIVAVEPPDAAGAATGLPAGAAQAAAAAAAAVVREAAAGTARDLLAFSGMSEEERAAKDAAAKEKKMRDMISALAALASNSGVAKERALFMNLLKKEIHRVGVAAAEPAAATMVFTGKGLEVLHPDESETLYKAAQATVPKRLTDRVSSILHRIELELDDVESKIGNKLKLIDKDGDGMISRCGPWGQLAAD